MPTFSIDDVRETFTNDVSSFLGKIEESTRILLGSPVFSMWTSAGLSGAAGETGLPCEPLREGRPIFTAISEFGHAIVGTTALVGADSLTDSARALEDLAVRGHEAFVDLDRCLGRARRAAELCQVGAERMRSMLDLELGGRPSEALWESIAWVETAGGAAAGARAEETPSLDSPVPEDANGAAPYAEMDAEMDASPTAMETDPLSELPGETTLEGVTAAPAAGGETHAEFSFEDEPAAPAMNVELRQIFDEEARGAVEAMETELAALGAEPTNLTTAGNLERLFHTLKGAAATVGLVEISEIAAALQERMEGVVESGTPVTADFIEELMGDINEMLRAAELPQIGPAARAGAADGGAKPADEAHRTDAAREAHAFFIDEARAALGEVTHAIPALSGGGAQAAAHARAELGRLFHRIKGSALIVGETPIGEESERLQLLMEGEGTSAVAAVAEAEVWLALVRARIGGAAANAADVPVSAAGSAVAAARHAGAPAPTRHAVQMASNPELGDAFMQECGELLEAINRELLNIEESNQPKQALEALMRQMHTLKGVVNTVGLGPTGEMLHRVEDLLEALQEAAILPPMRAVATLLFGVQGDVRKHLKQARDGYVDLDLPRLDARIARLLGRAKPEGAGAEPTGASLTGLTVGAHTAGQVNTETGASIHSIHSARSVLGVRTDEGRSQSASRSGGSQDDGLGRRYIRVATNRLDSLMNLAGELVVSRSRMLSRVGTLRTVQQEISFGHRRLVEAVEGFSEEHEFASVGGGGVIGVSNGNGNGARGRNQSKRATAEAAAHADPSNGTPRAVRPADDASGAARGGWESFGELELDRYEDVQILSRRLAEMTSDFSEMNLQLARNLAAFNDDSEVFGRIVAGIQSEVTRARMVPLEQLFTRLRLPVRDAATREGKEMKVAVEGADVHIDKTIADALFQPMLHLVRNAAVHGIERASVRERTAKSAAGLITLRARQESGQIVIEVADDGAGLDLERLRARGVAMGLIAAETPLSDPTVRDLVFASGLSTREQAGAVSGRGVGCDVVRRSVERLNGTIRVDSSPARGTNFIITLPVTLAIAKALIVRHGERTYAIPLHFAERIVDAQEEALIHSAGVHRIKIDDTFLTVRRLEQYFQSGVETNAGGPVLLLRVGAARTVLQVDAVLGQEEIVVKSLGDVLAGHPVFAGVTVRGSGDLALIVDVPGLLQDRARQGVAGDADRRRVTPRRRPGLTAPAADAAGGVADERPATIAADSAVVVNPSRPLKVLFIDDSLSVRKFAQITLGDLGADVTVAVDGVDGLAKIREGSFDLVFTDLEMPRMHGFELIRQVRFLPAYRDLPIIVVTSRSGTKHQQQARALGATEYLTKPFTAQNLDAILKQWGRRSAPAVRTDDSMTGDGGESAGSRRGDWKLS